MTKNKQTGKSKMPKLSLGPVDETYGLVTTMALPESGILPGIYFYRKTSLNIIDKVLEFAKTNLVKIFDKLKIGNVVGKGSDLIGKLMDCAKDITQNSIDVEFGVYMNTNSFGFLLGMPASALLLSFMPAVGMMGTAFLGTVSLSCKMRFSTLQITCAIGYDKPKWISAIFDGLELIAGAVMDTMEDAEKAIVDTFNGLGKAIVQVGAEIGEWAEDFGPAVANGVADFSKDAAKEVLAFGKDSFKDAGEAFKDIGKQTKKFFTTNRRRRRRIL